MRLFFKCTGGYVGKCRLCPSLCPSIDNAGAFIVQTIMVHEFVARVWVLLLKAVSTSSKVGHGLILLESDFKFSVIEAISDRRACYHGQFAMAIFKW